MKVFLSYSKNDYRYKDEIKTTLSKLERDGKIELWIDEKKLKAGEKFDKVIKAEIKSSDMFLLLLSRNFWASDYIQTYEMPLILERYKANEAIVVPIVLNDTFDLLGHDVFKGINGLPRDDEDSKSLKPIDDFKSPNKAYNSVLKGIIKQLPKNIEVYSGAKYNYLKVFFGYQYRQKDLVEYNLSQLTIPKENFEICSDIRTDKFWQDRVYQAINKAEYIVLFLSRDFIESEFIQMSMLPVVHRQYHLGKCSLSIFLLESYDFRKDETLNSFQIEPISKIEKLQLAIDKALKKGYDKIELDFVKLFSIYKFLQHYNEEKNQSIKISEDSFEIYEDNVLVERWKLITPKERIEEYAEIYKNSFDIKDDSYKFGLFQNKPLAGDVAKLQYFFETLLKLYKMEKITKEVIEFFVQQFGSFAPFIQEISNNKIFSIEMLDFNKDISNNTGSIFFFLRFSLEGYQESKLISKIYELIEQKFNISISQDNAQLYKAKSFIKTFEKALILLEQDRIIQFSKIIDSIDLLHSTLNIKENFSFIKHNMQLIDEPIVKRSMINISQLFVEPTARFYYVNPRKSETIKNVLNWFYRELKYKNFLILLGNFGHGKTTLFKYIVANLSKEYEKGKHIPVFLTLREHFKTNSSLQEAVTNAIMPNSRMSDEFWKNNKWIIFCDGFDELNIFHQDNPEWVTLVFSELLQASEQPNIKVIISSRPILFMEQKIHKKTIGNFETVILNNFTHLQIAQWLENWSKKNKTITIEMLKDRGIIEIAQTPVILFLIAMMFHDELADTNKKYSKSEIYRLFFDWTVKSGGYQEDEATPKHKVPKNYREIIQEIAWQIFTHPDSKSGLLHYKIILEQLKDKFGIKNFDSWDERIFVAHAFKESRKEHIEFLHQSLREYLVAERLFGVYYAMIDEPEYHIDIAYNKILLHKPISEAKVDFFIDMTRNLSSEKKRQLKIKAKNIAHWVTILYQIAEKDTSILTGYKIYRKSNNKIAKEHLFSENQVVLANLVLLGYFFEINLYEVIEEDFNLDLLKQIQNFFKTDVQLEEFEKLFKKFLFKNLKFLNNQFNAFNFNKYIFNQMSFQDLEFNNCFFDESQLKNVKFKNITFNNCNFYKIKWSTFKHYEVCEYKSCYFFRYDYQNRKGKEKVIYKKCIFEASDLYYENFEGVVFRDCIFIDTNFSTNDKLDRDTMDIEFVDCVLKKGGEIEGLNGRNLEIFVKTGG